MRSIHSWFLAVVLALGAVCTAGCSGGDDLTVAPPALAGAGEKNKTTITVTQTNFSHSVGKTECPQKIGTMTIKNNRDTPIRWSAERGQPAGTSTSFSQTSGKLAAGESVTVDVIFTCSQTTNVSEQWIVKVFDNTVTNGEVLNDTAVNINGTVK